MVVPIGKVTKQFYTIHPRVRLLARSGPESLDFRLCGSNRLFSGHDLRRSELDFDLAKRRDFGCDTTRSKESGSKDSMGLGNDAYKAYMEWTPSLKAPQLIGRYASPCQSYGRGLAFPRARRGMNKEGCFLTQTPTWTMLFHLPQLPGSLGPQQGGPPFSCDATNQCDCLPGLGHFFGFF